MSGRAMSSLALLAVLMGATFARADEIRLRDGSKIKGTIVGFENDSFKVETAYGFALLRKDSVADIVVSAPKTEPEPAAKKTPPRASPNIAAPTPAAPAAKESTSAQIAPPASKTVVVDRTAVGTIPSRGTKNGIGSRKSCTGSNCGPGDIAGTGILNLPSSSLVTGSVEPPVIRDDIRGNTYFNLTYGFQMYKPPSWDLIPGARKALPNAVAALGTGDETTLLVIGRESATDSLDKQAANTAQTLSAVYEDYRPISSRRVTIAGLPAIEQHSRGRADGRDWSVVLLTFVRGNDAFTLLGMTWADSDLIQVQENVIAKAVKSITFVPQ